MNTEIKSEYHILSLGAGVQSTTLYLMAVRGHLDVQFDCAIFADTQEEPAAVYRHLEWLQSLNQLPILVRTKGRLGDDLARGENSTGQRFVSIPAFTLARKEITEYRWSEAHQNEVEVGTGEFKEEVGKTRRQCSKEYKVEVIERTIRRDVLGLQPRQRIPKGTVVHQYIGISLDEAGRAARMRRIHEGKQSFKFHFPLIERFMTRPDCLNWLAQFGRAPHEIPRSACTFCPYHSDAEWFRLKHEDPEGWARAVYIDHQLRVPENIVNWNMNQQMFLHRSCKPLDEVEFNTAPTPRDLQLSMSFAEVCEGVCGV